MEVLVINSISAKPGVRGEKKTIRAFNEALAQLPKLRSVTFWNFCIVTALDFTIFPKVSDFSIINHSDYMYDFEVNLLWAAIFYTDFSHLTSLRIHGRTNYGFGPSYFNFEHWTTGNLTSVCISVSDHISEGSIEHE